MAKVCIVQRRLTHYRTPLFSLLRDMLAARGIQLELLIGHGTREEDNKHDAGELAWAKLIPTRYWLGARLCWQSIGTQIEGVDLLIVTQENKLLLNHLLMLRPRRFKLAFWGHGANFQSGNPQGLKERFKRLTTNHVDWWFAYTQMSANLVKGAGFPGCRVTVLNNAVDTGEFLLQRQSVTPEEEQMLRKTLDFGAGPVGIYVGSLYADKRLDFLLDAAEAIRAQVPDFHLLIIGEGLERNSVQAWCAAHPWAHWAGAKFGSDKAALMAVAQIQLNPGLVGLGILDSFVCGVPMLTTDCGIHSPEIVYLNNGVNGYMTDNDLQSYVDACVRLLRDPYELGRLREGCLASSRDYTVENMALRFTNGIVRCLETPRYGRGLCR